MASIINNPYAINGNIGINGSAMATISASSIDWKGKVILGKPNNNKSVVYIVEEWQSKNPIEIGKGLFISGESDLYSLEELEELVYNKIEEQFPEIAIKIGLDKNNIQLRKISLTVEIKE